MMKLQNLLKENRLIHEIYLEYENITDLTLLMSTLLKFPELTSLSLYMNEITVLPNCSQFKNLTHLNLSANPIRVDSYLLDSLYSLPKLQSLEIDASEQEIRRIIENVPTLKLINNKQIVRKCKSSKSKQQAEKIAKVLAIQKNNLQEIKADFLRKLNYPSKKDDWDDSANLIIEECVKFTRQETINDTSKEAVFFLTKSRMVDKITETILEALDSSGMYEVSLIAEKINLLKNQHIEAMAQLVIKRDIQESNDKKQSQDSEGLRKQKLYLRQISRLKKVAEQSRQQIEKLQSENQKIINNMYRQCKKNINNPIAKSPIKKQKDRPLPVLMPQTDKEESQGNHEGETVINRTSFQHVKQGVNNHQFQQSLLPKKASSQFEKQKKAPLTMEITSNLLLQILNQKREYNLRCLSRNECFETSEEFISTFFTRKYGLKSLAVNSSISFLNSLEAYSRKRTDFEVFLKVLKNRIEEEFFEVHEEFINMVDSGLTSLKVFEEMTPEHIFYSYFPEHKGDYPLKLSEIGTEADLSQFRYQLKKFHIYSHELHLREFIKVFEKHDCNGSGVLKLESAIRVATQFLSCKVNEGIIDKQIVKEVESRLMALKKNKIIFSELIDIIDNL